jgi:hypothetical protein
MFLIAFTSSLFSLSFFIKIESIHLINNILSINNMLKLFLIKNIKMLILKDIDIMIYSLYKLLAVRSFIKILYGQFYRETINRDDHIQCNTVIYSICKTYTDHIIYCMRCSKYINSSMYYVFIHSRMCIYVGYDNLHLHVMMM